MKKSEIILGIIAILVLILNLINIEGSEVLIILGLSILSMLYMYFSFALFNNIRFRKILKKESYKGLSKMRIVGAVLIGFMLSITILGLLFKFQSWPGGSIVLLFGISGLFVGMIVGLIKYQKVKSDYYSNIFKRIAIYGGIGVILMILPRETWLEIKNRNHPEYIQAVKKSWADPYNQELEDKVDIEIEKMNK